MFSVSQLAKYYGGRSIFTGVSLQVGPAERVGVIGRNGAGKTTLLHCFCGLVEPDAGRIFKPKGSRIAYLSQNEFQVGQDAFWAGFIKGAAAPPKESEHVLSVARPGTGGKSGSQDGDATGALECDLTVERAALTAFADLQEAEARLRKMEASLASGADNEKSLKAYGQALDEFERAGGYEFRHRTRTVLSGLGFGESQWSQPVDTLSGGERVRLALARLLLAEPDLALLDEPTNHLDIDAIEWLEAFLQRFRGSLIIVSHDRTFLDRVTQRTWEVDNGQVTEYRGGYSHALRQKEDNLRRLRKERAAVEAERAKLEAFVARFRAGTRASQAQDRKKKLERLTLPPPHPAEHRTRTFELKLRGGKAHAYGQIVCAGRGLQWGFGEEKLFGDLKLDLRAGERVALTGPNGAGKSTLLRLLVGEFSPQAGSLDWAPHTRIGYFSQHRHDLPSGETVLGTVLAQHPMGEKEARDLLGAFHFSGSQVEQVVESLSGGEQARLSLLLLMLSDANVLLLDEPTNHLDLSSRNALEEALEAFSGTLVVVSHDRYFLDRVSNVTWELREGNLRVWEGNFSVAREQMREQQDDQSPSSERAPTPGRKSGARDNVSTRSSSETTSPEQGLSIDRQALRALEERIEALESQKENLQLRLADPRLYRERDEEAAEAVNRFRHVEEELEQLYDQWEQWVEHVEELG